MKTAQGIFILSLSILALVFSAQILGIRFEIPGDAFAGRELEYRSMFVSAPVEEVESNPGWKQIDEKEFHGQFQQALTKLTYEGFEVLEVLPITRGRLDTGGSRHGAWGGGFGMTQGVLIVAVKRLDS